MKAILYTDGGARGNPGPAGAGAYAVTPEGEEIFRLKKYLGVQTNNQAEYQALILGLNALLERKFEDVLVRMDSELIVRQMQGKYKIKNQSLLALAQDAIRVARKFVSVDYRHVPREKNVVADALVNQAIDEAP